MRRQEPEAQRERTGRIPGRRRRKTKPRPSPRIKQSPRAALSVLCCTPEAGTAVVRDRGGPAERLPRCLLSSRSPWCARLSWRLRHISSQGQTQPCPLSPARLHRPVRVERNPWLSSGLHGCQPARGTCLLLDRFLPVPFTLRARGEVWGEERALPRRLVLPPRWLGALTAPVGLWSWPRGRPGSRWSLCPPAREVW